MDPIPAGLLGGLAGTVAMSALMMPMMKGAPSGPQVLWSKIRGVDAMSKEAQMVGMVIHFAYGTFWGGVLGWSWRAFDIGIAPWLAGLLLGIALLLLAMIAIMPALGMKPPPGKTAMMMMGTAAAHLLYGVVTGVVFGLLL